MRVLKITTNDGSVFHTDNWSPSEVGRLEKRAEFFGGVKSMELVKMTGKEYQATPATDTSSTFFGEGQVLSGCAVRAAIQRALSPEQLAVRSLAEVRKLIVDHLKHDKDWRLHHAQTEYIVNVVAGLVADAEAIYALYEHADHQVTPLREEITKLKEELAESKRPFTAQMEMQNRRITFLNAEVERLTALLTSRTPSA